MQALTRIAAANDCTISTEELRVLLPQGVFETNEALEDFISRDRVLSRELLILDGEVAPRDGQDLIAKRSEQRRLTLDRLELANAFTRTLLHACPWIELAGISGSTAYGGSKPHDDVDFFLVTQRNRMWITLSAAMALARLTRWRTPDSPVLCFNRVTERDQCARSFQEDREPLFAREALNLRILSGRLFYRELLLGAPWMRKRFPTLYDLKVREDVVGAPVPASRWAPHWFFANAIAFLCLAPYLWAMGLLRNTRLAEQGRPNARFRTVIERGFCAYESKKYDDLRDAYGRAF